MITPVRYAFPVHSIASGLFPTIDFSIGSIQTLWIGQRQADFLTARQRNARPRIGPAITLPRWYPTMNSLQRSSAAAFIRSGPMRQATQSNVRAEVLQTLAKAYGAPSRRGLRSPISPPSWRIRPSPPGFKRRSRAAGPARSADGGQGSVRRGGRARARSGLAALLRRALRRPAAGRPKGPPRLPKGEAPFIPADGAIPGAPEPLPETMDLRRGQAAPRHRQGLRRERHAGHAQLRDFRQERARPMVQLPPARPDQAA